jgi:hypothetical protein
MLEGTLSRLGILGWDPGQTASLHGAVRNAELEYLLDRGVVAVGLRAIKERNKIAHYYAAELSGKSASSDEEESADPVELILEQAPRVVGQLWILDLEIEAAAKKKEEKNQRERELAEEQAKTDEEARNRAQAKIDEEARNRAQAKIDEDARNRAQAKIDEDARNRAQAKIDEDAIAQKEKDDELARQQEEKLRAKEVEAIARRHDEEFITSSAILGGPEEMREVREKLFFKKQIALQEWRNARVAAQNAKLLAPKSSFRGRDHRNTRIRLGKLFLPVLLLISAIAASFAYWSVQKGNDEADKVVRSIEAWRTEGKIPDYAQELTHETLTALREVGVDVRLEMVATGAFQQYDGFGARWVREFALMELEKTLDLERAVWVILSNRVYAVGIRGAGPAAWALCGKSLEKLTKNDQKLLARATALGSLTSHKRAPSP